MKKRNAIAVLGCLLGICMLAGCGKAADDVKVDDTEQNGESSESNEQDVKEPEGATTEADNGVTPAEKPGESAKPTEPDSDEEENVWDGGPDFDSIADEFYGLTYDMTIEEALGCYAITLVNGGKYADYEGDIGEVIPEYKDVDLDGDHKPDAIKREGRHYVIEFSRGSSIKTGDFSDSPNEGEIIEFKDMAFRNRAEILIAHYTVGTAGPVVWDTAIYSDADGEWKAYPLVDKDGVICSEELRDHIAEKTGKAYDPDSVRVAGAEMTTLLLDYGTKDGPKLTRDYEAAYLHKYFTKDTVHEREDYAYSGSSGMYELINNWPLELVGETVQPDGDLQYKLNLFLSNFSEQHYGEVEIDYVAGLLHFALEWKKVNSYKDLVMRDDCYCLDHGSVNQILERYFGTQLDEKEFYGVTEDNPFCGKVVSYDGKGWYTEPLADGEMYRNNAFTVVTDVQEIGSGREKYVRTEFLIYARLEDDYEDYGIEKEQYSLSPDEAASLELNGKLILRTKGVAISEDAGSDGYWLLYYHIYDR
ncbi:MAG: hypothetical protein IK115_10255 [Lachnospiraceae bacterium]|nr:hypothetical protein [Lachnospiraceae bacterium]